ncbi:MAG: DUF4159 domain-containing protein [Candidatus Neomarinimicrobiota bacterium]|nr:DUF4159 domain-containing protein [Candidatus Neomarinimicrobiota bacterium]
MKIYVFIPILCCSLLSQEFSIARIQYGGGGDWYCDPSSLPNLLAYLKANTSMSQASKEVRIKLTDSNAKQFPYLYITGHGNIRFSNNEIIALRSILSNGGFLHADDNYGMDKSFRREIKKVFPNKKFVELPHSHPIFSSYYELKNGLPKVHEHDNRPPQALGIFENNKLVVLYTYESDLGDGWEDATVHNDPPEIRDAALKMGVNIIYYALTQ